MSAHASLLHACLIFPSPNIHPASVDGDTDRYFRYYTPTPAPRAAVAIAIGYNPFALRLRIHKQGGPTVRTRRSISVILSFLCVSMTVGYFGTPADHAAQGPAPAGVIEVDASRVAGKVPHYLFGQFIEHEHSTIDNGLLAELLRDRKFDEGNLDGNGVSSEWVPEERVQDRYWELRNGRGVNDRYYIDHRIYYGGGASQAIELTGPD